MEYEIKINQPWYNLRASLQYICINFQTQNYALGEMWKLSVVIPLKCLLTERNQLSP